MSKMNFLLGNCKDGETISGKVVHFHVGWLVLDARQKCSWAATQVTGKAKSQEEADFFVNCLMDIFLKYIKKVCGYLRKRSQFWVFNVIFVLSASKLIRNGYYYPRSKRSVKICCPVLSGTICCLLSTKCNSKITLLPFIYFALTLARSRNYLPFTLTCLMRQSLSTHTANKINFGTIKLLSLQRL